MVNPNLTKLRLPHFNIAFCPTMYMTYYHDAHFDYKTIIWGFPSTAKRAWEGATTIKYVLAKFKEVYLREHT